ncbi:hypothetical protein VTK73DRAFT_2677 [Phialemonium thermophilum]|uniref:Zn(2)-C6 fungal-type domain-containing protein n=1 Tax=Phialemonium thermophilum TaxID=223376 RepID=A0ABR3X323_9PEZI
MPPRRSHKKSRAGCRRCKTRKIKCDEVHPRCGNCVKHGVPCDFEHPEVAEELQQTPSNADISVESPSVAGEATCPTQLATSPAWNHNRSTSRGAHSHRRQASSTPTYASTPPDTASLPASSPQAIPIYHSPSSPLLSSTSACHPDERMLELRLMHQYTAATCKTLGLNAPAATEDVWRVTVPSLAFSGPRSRHLADAVLAVAALHLRSLCPEDPVLVRASHSYMATCISEYSAALQEGIDASNAEALFLTSALIAFQSTATRTFIKDEPFAGPSSSNLVGSKAGNDGLVDASISSSVGGGSVGAYAIPFSWFHSFQGVKAITAASWPYLRQSSVVTQIINSQVPLQLDFESSRNGFFGHLLDGLEEELEALDVPDDEDDMPESGTRGETESTTTKEARRAALVASTRQAYQHAVAALNWAHKLPHRGAALSFPATVSRRFVALLEERRPRALAVLACFFALLKSVDGVWWLQGMARREVLGVVGLFAAGGALGGERAGRPEDLYRRWWPHLEWAARIAVWDDSITPIPPEVWGADWTAEEGALKGNSGGATDFVSQIEILTQMTAQGQGLPVQQFGS